MKYFHYKKNKGFTLIEMMVATSIFIIIMIMAMGALLVSSNAAKQGEALHTAMDNVNFAMDSMSRSLRIGTHYYCVQNGSLGVNLTTGTSGLFPLTGSDCAMGGGSPGSAVAFVPASSTDIPPGTAVAYEKNQRADGTYTLQRCTISGCIDLVASNVNVQNLEFFVTGSSPTDTIQPSVYILMQGVVTVKGVPTSFAIQTMASQRSSE
jgi:type II secretory pathway pseudopilin PulG